MSWEQRSAGRHQNQARSSVIELGRRQGSSLTLGGHRQGSWQELSQLGLVAALERRRGQATCHCHRGCAGGGHVEGVVVQAGCW